MDARSVLRTFRLLGHGGDDVNFFSAGAPAVVASVARQAGVLGPEEDLLTKVDALTLACQALRLHEEEQQPTSLRAEFVATIPGTATTSARPTRVVIQEMLATGTDPITCVGYDVRDATFVTLLHAAAIAGRRVVLILDRARGSVDELRRDWPSDAAPPVCFQNRLRDGQLPYASMHAKALLVGDSDLLVTSANFTLHGLGGNVEFGVRVRGEPARQAHETLTALVGSDVLERIL